MTLTSANPARQTADALVVAVASSPAGPRVVGADWLPAETVEQVTGLAGVLGITGAVDEVRRLPAAGALAARTVVLTGVGPLDEVVPDAETLRRAAGAALRELTGAASVAVALPAEDAEQVAAVAEGALLGAYAYTRYRSGEDAQSPAAEITVLTPRARDKSATKALARAEVLAAAVHGVRDLVNAAPNDLYPAAFADAAKAAVKDTGAKGVKVTVLDEKALAAGGYGGILGVGQGSARPPRLVKVS